MKTLGALLAMVLFASVASADELSWAQLAAKKEFWPKQCAIKSTMQFQDGGGVRAGQKVDIVEITATEVVVMTTDGTSRFAVEPNDTDALAVANAAYAQMTPKQRELTAQMVMARRELWPYRLTLTDSFDIGNKRLKKGDSVYLMDVKNGELVVAPPTFDLHFELLPDDTDLLVQARKIVDNPEATPGRLVEELNSKLVNPVTGEAKPLDMNSLPRYYILYSAARWCPYTQKFTPELLKAYEELKANHPDFEVIYLPQEKTAAELQLYAKELSFPWPVVRFDQKEKLAVVATVLGRSSTPEIEVVDRYGTLLIDNAQYDREEVLKRFQAMLETEASLR